MVSEVEHNRFREHMVSQQEWHTQRIIEKEEEIVRLKARFAEESAQSSAVASLNNDLIKKQAESSQLVAQLNMIISQKENFLVEHENESAGLRRLLEVSREKESKLINESDAATLTISELRRHVGELQGMLASKSQVHEQSTVDSKVRRLFKFNLHSKWS